MNDCKKNLSNLDVASHIRSEHKFNLRTSMNISTYFNSSTKLTAKRMKVIVFASAMLACSLNAIAQKASGFYSEVAYSNFSIKDVSPDNSGTLKPSVVRLTFGGLMVDNFALEGFLLQNLQSDSLREDGITDFSVKTSYGIALRPFVNLSNNVELYGRLGSVRLKVEGVVTDNGISSPGSASNTHTLLGAGLGFKLNNNLKLVADYTRLSTVYQTKSSMITVGMRLGF